MRALLTFVSVTLVAMVASAATLTSTRIGLESEVNRDYGSSTLTFDGSLKNENPSFDFSHWNFAFTGNRAKSENTTSGEISITQGRDFFAGVGFQAFKNFLLDLGLSTSTTPETQFRQSAVIVNFAYRHDPFLSEEENESSTFPFRIGLGFSGGKVNQTISFKILNTPIERDIELDQKYSRLFASFSPWEWLTVKIDGKAYSYSKSKQDLQTAYQSRFLNYYTSDLVSNIGGLPETSGSIGLIFVLSDRWDLELFAQSSRLIVDDSNSRKSEILATRYFKAWDLGFGLSQSETSGIRQASLILSGGFQF